jgi:hypothetical protein
VFVSLVESMPVSGDGPVYPRVRLFAVLPLIAFELAIASFAIARVRTRDVRAPGTVASASRVAAAAPSQVASSTDSGAE